MLGVDPHVVGEDDANTVDDVGVGRLIPRARSVAPQTVFEGSSTHTEVVRLLLDHEGVACAEPLITCVIVGEGMPHSIDRYRVGALDDEGSVRLAALNGVGHFAVSL